MERSRTSGEKVMLCIVYVAIAAFVYAMNSFMPYYDDDIWYSYRYVAGEELSPLRHIGDVFESQYWHYINENGRAVVHVILQTLLEFLPECLFDILNTMMFLLLLTLVAKVADGRLHVLTICFAAAAVLWLLPAGDYLFYWASGSLNYLWTSVATLLFMIVWNNVKRGGGFTQRYRIVWVVLSFLAGWSHEALALPVCIVILLWMAFHYRRIGLNMLTLVTLAYSVGVIALVFAPSMDVRTESLFANNMWGERIAVLFVHLRELRALPLLYFVWLITFCIPGGRRVLRLYRRQYGIWIYIHAVSLLFALYVGSSSSNMRPFYGLEFFSVVLLTAWVATVAHRLSRRTLRFTVFILSGVWLVWALSVSLAAYRVGSAHRAMFADYAASSNGIVYLPNVKVNPLLRPWVMDLRQRYWADWESDWRCFVIPLSAHLDTVMHVPRPMLLRDSCGCYKLYNRYVCVFPSELRDVVERPREFFVEEHRVPGDNPFYRPVGGRFMIALLDSVPYHGTYCWQYEPVSWRDPAYSLSGVLRRMVAPGSYPDSEPVQFPDTVMLPGGVRYMVVEMPRYRRVKSVEQVVNDK